MRSLFFALLSVVVFTGCFSKEKNVDPTLLTDQNLLHQNVKQLTEVIIHDMFSPPVASRIYAYSSLAAYEAVKFSKPGYPSIAAHMNELAVMPTPENGKNYNYLLASSKAFFTVAEKITFSKDTLANYEKKLYANFKSLLDRETYERSLAFGEAVGKAVLERTTKDHYKETRGMAKYIGDNSTGKWRPTPPDYADGAEPYWGTIKPLLMDSAGQFKCPAPPAFDTHAQSPFYKNAYEVYTVGKNLTDEQRTIARYWDDNPFVTEHAGHLMYGNKKVTPVGHWMGITAIASKMNKDDAVETAKTYVMTTAAMFDAIISCWEEKYRTQVIRPITVINEHIDRNWQPFIQTPPFPEYSSGHSGISASAATVLTHRYGKNFAFDDTTEVEYIGMKRSFPSFEQAAEEAGMSRMYGGIHYRTGIEAGAMQGKEIGEYVIQRIEGGKLARAGQQ